MIKQLTNIIIVLALFAFTLATNAQGHTVSGSILNESDSLSLIGVTVVVKGTYVGTTTDFEGKFTLSTESAYDTLQISYIGYQTQFIPVAGRSQIDLFMREERILFDEVVVTAMGVSKQSKAIGYAMEKVKSEEIVEGNDRSFLNAIQGKVAGVNISGSSGAPGASTRILMRGISSLGSNQPLFVVDGVPISNGATGSTSINGGTDFGNRANDINPEDIESITVLKGAAAAAAYGSRATNGVIVITTKRGAAQENKKARVTVSSSLELQEPLRLVKYQNHFGQGLNGESIPFENYSWGPQFDGVNRFWGNLVDSSYRVKPYVALPNNVREFFDVGIINNNTISISGGNEKNKYYVSYSNVFSDGIFPTNSDSYTNHRFTIRDDFSPRDNIIARAAFNYIRKKNSYVPTGQRSSSVYNMIMQTPRDISLLELEDLNNDFNSLDNHYSLYTVNPYHILENNSATSNEDRIYGNLNFSYEPIKNLLAEARLGGDISSGNGIQTYTAPLRPEGNNEFSSVFDPGRLSRTYIESRILNSNIMLTYSKQIKDFDLLLRVGQDVIERRSYSLYNEVNDLTFDGLNNISNTSGNVFASEGTSLQRNVTLFSNIEASFKNYLYLTLAVNNEWTSTLNPGNNSYMYPAASLSFLFSELLPSIYRVLPYGKVRASYSVVGNGASPYRTNNVFVQGSLSDGFGALRFPFGGVNGYASSKLLRNPKLRHESTEEFEIGTDLRFLRNRIGVDFTYYHRTTTDLIQDIPVPSSSGYISKVANLGKLENKGFEVLLSAKPVKKSWIQWEMSFNFTKNYNKLLSLNESTEEFVLTGLGVSGGRQINYVAIPGQPLGVFQTREIMTDDAGRIVVDNQGLPIGATDLVTIGNIQEDFILGMTQSIEVKGIRVSATFDWKQGGLMYSQTKAISAATGTIPITLYNNREPFVIPNSVVEVITDDGSVYMENTKPLDAEALQQFWANGGYDFDAFALIDKTFIKLRQVAISYDLPLDKVKIKIPLETLSVNVVGRNLWLWTPEDQQFIDPESTTFGNDLISYFGEYGATPSVRSISFGIRAVF